MLIDDIRDVFGMALKKNGHSINTKNEDEIKEAYESLVELKKNVLLYNSDAPQVPYISGEVSVGMQWNGNAFQGQQELPELKFVMPQEGAVLWMDNYTIPSGSKNIDLAHKFINFMFEPEQQAEIVNSVGYASATKGGRELLSDELKHNTTIFPSEEDMKKGEFINDVGPETLAIYDGTGKNCAPSKKHCISLLYIQRADAPLLLYPSNLNPASSGRLGINLPE